LSSAKGSEDLNTFGMGEAPSPDTWVAKANSLVVFRRLLSATMLLYAGALALMAVWHHFPVACAAAFAAGSAWTAAFSTFNTSIQLNTAAWVRGRSLAFYQLTYSAGLGVGSALRGYVAEHSCANFINPAFRNGGDSIMNLKQRAQGV